MIGATHSAVIVPFPAAEKAVAAHRAQFDRAARWGVPAHVTVLYPFIPPPDIDAHILDTLAAAIASVPCFQVTCEAARWFGTDVLWLDPQPAASFCALTTAVLRAFPGYPPYGGVYEEVIPHLTVGHDADAAELRRIEQQVLPHLPIRMAVTSASLWCGSELAGSWQQAAVLPLG